MEEGSLNGTHFEDQTWMQMYVNFQGFPFQIRALFGLVSYNEPPLIGCVFCFPAVLPGQNRLMFFK